MQKVEKQTIYLNITTKNNKIETKITFFYKNRKFFTFQIRIFEKKLKIFYNFVIIIILSNVRKNEMKMQCIRNNLFFYVFSFL